MANYTRGLITGVKRFLVESNCIEGICREPTKEEIAATVGFLMVQVMTFSAVCELQKVYAPEMPLRTEAGMNVYVGEHVPMPGGVAVSYKLEEIVIAANDPSSDAWKVHIAFETLHPFMGGNGRTGRALWAWHMLKIGINPFSLSFLHRFYYQTLHHVGR